MLRLPWVVKLPQLNTVKGEVPEADAQQLPCPSCPGQLGEVKGLRVGLAGLAQSLSIYL